MTKIITLFFGLVLYFVILTPQDCISWAVSKNDEIRQSVVNVTNSTLKNYQCIKCEVCVKKDKYPSFSGCPEGGNHNWKDLGTYGDNQFLCKKCSLLLKSKSMPNCAGCPKGGNHEWKKL